MPSAHAPHRFSGDTTHRLSELPRALVAGATGGVAAASTLLTAVLPAALGSPLEQFLSAMESSGDAAVEADAAELR